MLAPFSWIHLLQLYSNCLKSHFPKGLQNTPEAEAEFPIAEPLSEVWTESNSQGKIGPIRCVRQHLQPLIMDFRMP